MTSEAKKAKAVKKPQPGVVTLSSPVTVDDEKYKSLTMRAPKVGDQLAVEHTKLLGAREAALFANLCEVSPEVIAELSLSDYGLLQQAYTSFLT
jgi:hypothetical protein